MKKTIIKLVCFLLLIPFALSAVGCGGDSVVIPEYSSDDVIEIIAYSTPTNANWDGNSSNKEGITDEVFKAIAEAGFTGLQPLREGLLIGGGSLEQAHEKANADALKAMALCEKYGMHYMVRDWTFLGGFNINDDGSGTTMNNHAANWREYFANGGTIESGLEEMFALESTKEVVNHAAYAGHHLWDEPNIQQMEDLIPVVRKYKELVPNGDSFFNLLPCYASREQLGTTGSQNYEYYVDYYCENIGETLGYICYDYYPYNKTSFSTSVRESYLYNFEVVANAAKQYDIDFKMYIQAGLAFGQSSRDIEGTYDFLQQMYLALAYGCNYIIYFTYGYGGEGNAYLVDADLNPTAKYYYAKEANEEIHKLEDVMLNFTWDKTIVKNANPDRENQAFNWLTDPTATHSRITNWTVTQDTVVGCLKDKDGRDGFMFVNYADPGRALNRDGTPGEDISDDVTVTFDDAKKILVYEHGERKVVDGNTYTFKLGTGEGQFVIPLN